MDETERHMTPEDWDAEAGAMSDVTGQGQARVRQRQRAVEIEKKLEETEKLLVSGFYVDREYPHYCQGPPTTELQSVITAEEANGLVSRIHELEMTLHQARIWHTRDKQRIAELERDKGRG